MFGIDPRVFEAYENILYSTRFKPAYYIHLTYAEARRPSKYSVFPEQDLNKFLQAVSFSIGQHIKPFVGVGKDHHSHGVICCLEDYEASISHARQIERLWRNGMKRVEVFDRERAGAGYYTLAKHDVFDADFSKVYCPRIHHRCKASKKGCPFKWKKELLDRQTSPLV